MSAHPASACEVKTERAGPVAFVRYGSPGNQLSARGLRLLRMEVDALLAGSDRPKVLVIGGLDGNSIAMMSPSEGLTVARLAPPLPAALIVPSVRLAGAMLRRSRGLRRLLLDRPALEHRTALLNLWALASLLESGPAISIAALRGPTVGGGLEIALCCDLRVACDDEETWLAQPEVLAGVMVGFGASARLPRIVGLGRSLDLMLTGDALCPKEALSIGLVTRIYPKDRFQDEVSALASRLAARAQPAMSGTRRSARMGLDVTLSAAQGVELREVLSVWRSPEAESGLARAERLVSEELSSPSGRRLPEWLSALEVGVVTRVRTKENLG